MYRYEHSNVGMSVCIHDKGCTCHSVALSSSVCEGWPEHIASAKVDTAARSTVWVVFDLCRCGSHIDMIYFLRQTSLFHLVQVLSYTSML